MSYSWQSLTTLAATDGDFTVAAAVSLPVFSSLIPGDKGQYQLTQEWQQFLANFSPLPLNTAHPDYASYYLTKEGPLADVGGGMVKWSREYSQIPTSPFYDWETTTYTYPGVIEIAGLTSDLNNTSRGPYTQTTLSRVRHDYYICESSGTLPGGYTDPGQIPAIRQTLFVSAGTLPATGAKVGAVYAQSQYVVPINGASLAGVGVFIESVPNTSQYIGMVADAGAHGWSATQTTETITYDTSSNANYIALTGTAAPTWGGIIYAEDSRLARWRGAIYIRTVREVLAK